MCFKFLIAKLSRIAPLLNSCGQFDEQLDAIGLNLCFVCRAVAVDLAAAGAAVDDDKSFFGIGFCADRLHFPLAFAGAVAGIDVHVKRPEAEGAVIA